MDRGSIPLGSTTEMSDNDDNNTTLPSICSNLSKLRKSAMVPVMEKCIKIHQLLVGCKTFLDKENAEPTEKKPEQSNIIYLNPMIARAASNYDSKATLDEFLTDMVALLETYGQLLISNSGNFYNKKLFDYHVKTYNDLVGQSNISLVLKACATRWDEVASSSRGQGNNPR